MASGNTLLIFSALHAQFPSSNYATIDQRNASTPHYVLDFDESTDESTIFSGIMPQAYSGGGVTVYLHFAMTTATSGEVVWDGAFERIGEVQDIDSDNFASAQSSGAITVSGTSGIPKICSIAFTDGAQIASIVAGEGFRLKITRDADNGDDDASGDAELIFVEIRET